MELSIRTLTLQLEVGDKFVSKLYIRMAHHRLKQVDNEVEDFLWVKWLLYQGQHSIVSHVKS